jgi:hypothetical protein
MRDAHAKSKPMRVGFHIGTRRLRVTDEGHSLLERGECT